MVCYTIAPFFNPFLARRLEILIPFQYFQSGRFSIWALFRQAMPTGWPAARGSFVLPGRWPSGLPDQGKIHTKTGAFQNLWPGLFPE